MIYTSPIIRGQMKAITCIIHMQYVDRCKYSQSQGMLHMILYYTVGTYGGMYYLAC